MKKQETLEAAAITNAQLYKDVVTLNLGHVEHLEIIAEMADLPASVRGSFQGTAQAFQASLANDVWLILAALVTVIAAPAIVDAALASGLTQQQGYMLTAMVFGLLGSLPFIAIFFVIRETADVEETRTLPVRLSLQTAW